MTWNEIFTQSKTQNHSVNINILSKESIDHLKKMKINDIDQLWSLRLTGIQRIWGILDRGVFTLLWWDPNHQVCPSHKKHT